MTMFEVGIIILLQIKKIYMNDEFDQSLVHTLKTSKPDLKYRETWDLLQATVKTTSLLTLRSFLAAK